MCCHTGMPCCGHRTWHPTTVYRHGADLSMCYPIMWNVTLEYKLLILMSWVRLKREILPRTSTQTSERSTLWYWYCGSSVESTIPTRSWTQDLWCANPLHYPLAHFWTRTIYWLGTSIKICSVGNRPVLVGTLNYFHNLRPYGNVACLLHGSQRLPQ